MPWKWCLIRADLLVWRIAEPSAVFHTCLERESHAQVIEDKSWNLGYRAYFLCWWSELTGPTPCAKDAAKQRRLPPHQDNSRQIIEKRRLVFLIPMMGVPLLKGMKPTGCQRHGMPLCIVHRSLLDSLRLSLGFAKTCFDPTQWERASSLVVRQSVSWTPSTERTKVERSSAVAMVLSFHLAVFCTLCATEPFWKGTSRYIPIR